MKIKKGRIPKKTKQKIKKNHYMGAVCLGDIAISCAKSDDFPCHPTWQIIVHYEITYSSDRY